jgi:hypothetical protein
MSKIDYVYRTLENKNSKIQGLINPNSKLHYAYCEADKDHFTVLGKLSRQKLQTSSSVMDFSPKNNILLIYPVEKLSEHHSFIITETTYGFSEENLRSV